MESMTDGRLSRRWLVGELLRDRGDLLVVAGLGSAVWADDRPNGQVAPVWGWARRSSSGRTDFPCQPIQEGTHLAVR
jgi:hypothetical protein